MQRHLFTIFIFIFLFFHLTTSAQKEDSKLATSTTGATIGKMVDGNGQPIAFATIYVLDAQDSVPNAYGITDENGKFTISAIPFGKHILKIDYIGYRTLYTSPFSISKENPVFRMQPIKLTEKVTMLGNVEIRAEREMLQSNLDKKVFNVENSITTDGATAVEVLEEIPSIDVDLDGNVTLRGSENVTILVDGRPTHLTLEQIPANMIESIEVITNPSARLEPDGMSGILNVVLKKERKKGFNGMVSLRSGLYFFDKKPNFGNGSGNISLNYSYKKINLFINYDARYFGRKSGGNIERDSWFGNDTMHISQDNLNRHGGWSHNVQGGIDWFINKKNTLSLTLGYNYHKRQGDNTLSVVNDSILSKEHIPYENYLQTATDQNIRHNFTSSLNYKKTFETKGQELTADLFFSQRNGNEKDTTTQDYYFPTFRPSIFQKTTTKDRNLTSTAQVDFVTPVGKGGRIETGYKLSYRSIGQDYKYYTGNDTLPLTQDFTRSNHFIFSEIINAAYFIYSNTFWNKLKIQLGLRGEIANTKSDLKSQDTIYRKNYYNLFPTAHIRYDINDQHSIQFSYSRRVTRPSIWQLNPFMNVSDKLNRRAGNPNLMPEFVNSFELGYLMNIKKTSLNITAYYRQRNNIISRYTEMFQDSIDNEWVTYTLTTYQNLKKSQNFGIELVFGQQLWKFWKISLSGSFYRLIIDSEDKIDENLTRDWTWNARLNQTFSLPKDWDLQLNCRYRAPSLTTGSMGWGTGGVGQGKRSGNYSIDIGVKKSFLNKSLVLSLNTRNLISSYRTKVHTYSYRQYNGYDAYSIRQNSRINISLSISYKINNYKKRPVKTIGDDEGEDME